MYLALYELDDAPLVDLLEQAVAHGRARIILTSTGSVKPNLKNTRPTSVSPPHVVDRMFTNSARIGHNKFAVYVAADDTPAAVMTGSTNWTPTGLCWTAVGRTRISRRTDRAQHGTTSSNTHPSL